MPKGIYTRTEFHKSRYGFQRGHKINLGKPSLLLGRKCTEGHKSKVRKALMGHIVSLETRKKISNSHLGIKPTEETRQKLIKSHLGQKAWNKGKKLVRNRKSPYVVLWNDIRKAIYKRDSWSCQECGVKCGKYIACHHIDYDPSNNDPRNLITLCKSCHSKTNFKRGDWMERYKKDNGGVLF